MAAEQKAQVPPSAAEDDSAGAPAWIVTFADMMSLLLCFFVLLLSLSTTDAQKFKAVADSLREAFKFTLAPVPGTPREETTAQPDERPPLMPPPRTQTVAVDMHKQQIEAAKRVIDDYIETTGLSKYIETRVDGTNLKVVNSNPLNFPAGEATLLESSFEYLDALLPVVGRFDFDIIVEGHTDDRPINTAEFRSNWELSAARAASFVLYLEANGIDPSRLAVHGYGPHRPIAPNDSEENRARNRRIEILLKQPESAG